MAAQIVEEGVFLRKRKDLAQLILQQAHVFGRHGVPGAGHGGDIIEHVAFGLLHCAEIRDDLGGLHDHLAQQQCAGTDNVRRHVHHPHQGMNLREIAAVCTELFPDIGHRIQTNDVYTLIAEIEHVLGHVVEDNGIGIVQVPLVGIEGRHHDLVSFFTPAEVARSRGGKYLRDRLLKLIRNRPVIVEEVPCLALSISGPGFFRPLVILTGVVHHEIQTEGDASVVAVRRQRFQIFHRAQFRLDPTEVCHRIAAVAAPLRALEDRHQMQIVHAAVFNVIQLAAHPVQAAGKGADIHQHTQKVMSPVPVGILQALPVQLLQRRGALLPGVIQHPGKIVPGCFISVIQVHIACPQLFLAVLEAGAKLRFPLFSVHI